MHRHGLARYIKMQAIERRARIDNKKMFAGCIRVRQFDGSWRRGQREKHVERGLFRRR